MSDPTAPVEGAGTAPEASPASTPEPWAPVMDRVGELASTVESMQTGFQQFMQSQQPEPEPESDPWAALFPEEAAEPEQYAQPEQPQLDPQALQSAFQQAVQQANAPLQQQLQRIQAERDRETLLAEIPQLKDPAVAQAHIDSMFQALQSSGASQDVIAWALSSPQQIALHFKAAEAEKLAAGQAPASEQVPSLESAGGATPGGNGEQQNIVHQVMASRGGGLPKGFA